MTGPGREEGKEPISERGTEDLRLLVTIALSTGRKGLDADTAPIFAAWRNAFPRDALGPLGLGLAMFKEGRHREAVDLIRREALTAETRADQARDALAEIEGLAEVRSAPTAEPPGPAAGRL